MERNDSLIKKKIYKYMLTGVMSTIALQLGNVVDAMIVGNLIGSDGNAAVSASIPFIFLLQAAAILLGNGGAVSAAVLLGKRDSANADKVMGFCLFFSVAYPLMFTLASPAAVPLYAGFSGTDGSLRNMVTDLTMIYSLGMPFISLVLTMSFLMNIDNHSALSAHMNILANAVNLVLDFILVRFTSLGIKGAALSTVLGYVAAGAICIPIYIRSKNRMMKPDFRGWMQIRPLLMKTVRNGIPPLMFILMSAIGLSITNRAILDQLGKELYSAYAVANNTQNIVQMFLAGISSVIASVAGVFYGEKDYYGMRVVLKRVLKAALTSGAVITAVFLAFPQALAALYGFDKREVMPELLTGLRVFSLSFGFFILNAVSQNYYRTTGHTFLAGANTAMELLLLKVPLMLAGLRLFGFIGLFGAIIVSELLSFVILNLLRILMQKRGKVPQKGFMAIPETDPAMICDFSVRGSDEQAVSVSEKIIECCVRDGMAERNAKIMGLAAEELVANIGQYGYPNQDRKDIDICLTKTEDKYYLRIRDDGIPFDPVAYEPENRDPDKIGGLELLKKMALKISYIRVISLNNSIIEISDEINQ